MTGIEWTDETWNPVRGCSRVSEGCRHCYAERVAHRFGGPGQPYEGLVRTDTGSPRWTGSVRLVPELLDRPLRWRKPRRVFVNSMSDLFHPGVPDEFIDRVLAVMLLAPQHTFQVLTKRPARMKAYFEAEDLYERVLRAARESRARRPRLAQIGISNPTTFPARWLWLGVSVEDQATADERIPLLLQTPAALRFVSYEPALGPIDWENFIYVPSVCRECRSHEAYYQSRGSGDPGEVLCMECDSADLEQLKPLDWVIAGSESGPRARPAELMWFRDTKDQLATAKVPFFFKQWVGPTGDGIEAAHAISGRTKAISLPLLDGRQWAEVPGSRGPEAGDA